MADDYPIAHFQIASTVSSVDAYLYNQAVAVGGAVALSNLPAGSKWWVAAPAALASFAANNYRIEIREDAVPSAFIGLLRWTGTAEATPVTISTPLQQFDLGPHADGSDYTIHRNADYSLTLEFSGQDITGHTPFAMLASKQGKRFNLNPVIVSASPPAQIKIALTQAQSEALDVSSGRWDLFTLDGSGVARKWAFGDAVVAGSVTDPTP